LARKQPTKISSTEERSKPKSEVNKSLGMRVRELERPVPGDDHPQSGGDTGYDRNPFKYGSCLTSC